MRRLTWGCWFTLLFQVLTAPAAAQDTREAELAAAQAAKAKNITPQQITRGERIALAAKNYFEEPNGFYPWFGSVYSGGGFTLGAGYRRFVGDQSSMGVRGLYSLKSYKLIEFHTDSKNLASGAVDLHFLGGWRDATEVSYYGLGQETPTDAKSNFRMQQAFVGGSLRARGPAATIFDAGVQYEDYRIKNGMGASPSTELIYTSDTAPGLGSNPAFVHTTLGGGFDTRPAEGYARRGGLYAVTYDSFLDTDETFTFDRVQAEAVQHIPILRETWVLSLHGVVKTTLNDDDVVPFYLLPSLGSGSTLRAYPSWRFRDRHSLLVSGEWRWIPSRTFMDMAFFYDAGKVTSRREDLDFSGLSSNFGVGVRFHTPTATPLRIDFAQGDEGFNIVFSGGAAF